MASIRTINYLLNAFCKIGFLLSLYVYKVEVELDENKNYDAVCDINEYISCTKTLQSESSTGFGVVAPLLGPDSPLNVSNSLFGLGFYFIVWFLAKFNGTIPTKLVLILNLGSNLATIYLASLLYQQQNICPLCVGIYLVNFINLILSIKKIKALSVSAVPIPAPKPRKLKQKSK